MCPASNCVVNIFLFFFFFFFSSRRRHTRSDRDWSSDVCSSDLLGDDKAYRATICFGATSTTDDLDGELTPVPRAAGAGPVGREEVEAGLAAMLGERLQRPPAYSAIQVGGRRAYDMAR